jgi:hypothetical protein
MPPVSNLQDARAGEVAELVPAAHGEGETGLRRAVEVIQAMTRSCSLQAEEGAVRSSFDPGMAGRIDQKRTNRDF